jgi:hypothetical protein
VPPSVGTLAAKNPEAADARGAIYAVAPSFKTVSTIWAGTDDGKLWTTRDGGAHWADITPAALTPWSKVTQLEASHFDDVSAYASVSRFRVDDLTPYIYKTHDAGKTWSLITGGLPASPVNAVREDPVRKGLLYASTQTGVWVSFDEGATWQSLQRDLPRSSARDLVVHDGDLIVATHGRGFWILDGIAALRQVTTGMSDTLFKPSAAYRAPRSTYPDTPVSPDEPYADNPPDGAMIDYYLATPAQGPVTLEISDARGKRIRGYASTDKPELSDDEIAEQLIPAYWIRPYQALGTSAGGHRFVWDLRGERPVVDSYEYPISAAPHDTPRTPQGPRVAPGSYTIKLTIRGKPLTTTVEVRADPRVKLSAAAAAQQNQLEHQLAELVTRSSDLVLQAQSTIDQLGKLAAKDPLKAPIAAAAVKAKAALSGAKPAPGGPPAPTLSGVNGKLTALYKAAGVDAQPTAVQLAETAKAERELGQLLRAWDAFKAIDLAQLDTALKAAGLSEIRPELAPETHQANGDEE